MTFDSDGFGKKMNGIVSGVQKGGTQEAVQDTLKDAFKRSQKLVPKDCGNLANSGKVVKGAVVYDEDYAEVIEFKVKPYLRPAMARNDVRGDIKKNTAKTLTKIIKSVT